MEQSDTTQCSGYGDDTALMSKRKYDASKLTYSTTFENATLQKIIAGIEWMTGKITVLRWVRRFEKMGVPKDHRFFTQVLQVMGIVTKTPEAQIKSIPATGPVVVVANHPHGMVDGVILADLIGRVRTDYRILTRSLLTNLDETAAKYMISVPFPHDDDAQNKGLQMRKEVMQHLTKGGIVAVFPSGVVATSDGMFGPAIEREWNIFTSKIIQKSGAVVVPIKFSGQNSRWYHIANRLSDTLRQSLLIYEIVNQKNKAQAPTIGTAISYEECKTWASNPRGFMVYLRELTMSLPENPC